jgi:hypothetical protein
VFVQSEAGSFDIQIDGKTETIGYALTKAPRTRSFKNHSLYSRPATASSAMPETSPACLASQPYIVVAIVRSAAFETRLNDARTGINISLNLVEEIVGSVGAHPSNRE